MSDPLTPARPAAMRQPAGTSRHHNTRRAKRSVHGLPGADNHFRRSGAWPAASPTIPPEYPTKRSHSDDPGEYQGGYDGGSRRRMSVTIGSVRGGGGPCVGVI